MNGFPGDHPDSQAVWLDDKATEAGPCPTCMSARVLHRERANYGPDLPIHRHVVEVCLDCETWQIQCVAALDEAERKNR